MFFSTFIQGHALTPESEYAYRYLVNTGDAPMHRGRYHGNLRLGDGGEGGQSSTTVPPVSQAQLGLAVDLATCTATGRAVAVKTVKMNHDKLNKYARELRIWEALLHPNVLELLDWCTNPTKPSELCEYSL